MLTYFLMAYVCTTAARDDCDIRYIAEFHGASASIRCEVEREAWLDGKLGYPPIRGNELIRLECETE